MSRDYLKAWAIFDKEVEKLWPKMEEMIKNSQEDLEGQLHALQGMSSIKVEAPKIRE